MIRPLAQAFHRMAIYFLWAGIAGVSIYGPVIGPLEGALLPVTSPITFASVTKAEDGLLVTFTYEKYWWRGYCEFHSAAAMADGKQVDFERQGGAVGARLPGQQTSKVWRVGVKTLAGLQVFFLHHCSPYWLTVTKVYG